MLYNLHFKQDIKYFILFLVTLESLFNIIPFPFYLIVNTFLCALLVYVDSSFFKKLTYNFYLWFFFTIAITFLTFVFLIFTHIEYGIDKNIKAIVIGLYNFFYIFILYVEYSDIEFNNNVKLIFGFQIVVEIMYFFSYLKSTRISRFHGSFPEPVVMGFWLGVCFFIVLLQFKTKFKHLVALLLLYILYFHSKAKFALLCFPLALLLSIPCKVKKSKPFFYYLLFSFVCILICLYAFFSNYIISLYFKLIRKFFDFDSTNTFVTRFFYLFSSLKSVVTNPFGTGFGLEYEYYYPYFDWYIELANNCNVDTSELIHYVDPNTIVEKDSISVITGHFGLFGLLFYLYNIIKLESKVVRNKYLVYCLIIFVFLESCVCITFYGNLMFVFAQICVNSFTNNKKKIVAEYSESYRP